jgi:transcriptional regulator with GAF, ATPase, and Fis domain
MPGMVDHPSARLPGHKLSEGVTAMFRAVSKRLPLASLCIVQPDGSDDVVLTHADTLGTSGHRIASTDVSETFRLERAMRAVTEAELASHPHRVIEARLLMTGMPDAAREPHRTRQAIVVALPGSGAQAVLIVGLSTPGPPSQDELNEASRCGAEAWQLLNRSESAEEELARLRRVGALEAVLPALVEAMDIREIFERVSEISKQALAHDFLSIGTFNDDRTQVQLYAQTSDWKFPEAAPVQFAPVLVDTFTYHLIGNLLTHPIDAPERDNDFGVRSSLRVPVRVNKKVVAALNFSSRSTDGYGASDITVAQRIAEYVAIAISHQRLAEESHRAAALQERETNLKMLDGLLSTLAGVLDVRTVFDRVSEIAKKVLPHDLLGLPLYSSDGEHLIVHAVVGVEPLTTPIPLSPMHRRLRAESWDHLIFDDILLDPDLSRSVLVPRGVRSLLRVAIRVEQQLVGFLDFGMFTTGYYQPGHVLVARRIADHVALALSHHRLAEESRRATALAERTANLEVLDGLLSTLTGVLDITEVFARVSEIASKVLPHDMMALPVLTEDRNHIIPLATVGVPGGHIPPVQPLNDTARRLMAGPWDIQIVEDIATNADEADNRFIALGQHAMIRAPIRLEGQLVAALVFFSKTVGAYSHADGLIAKRIADHVALVMSHKRLADQSRRAAALQERTASLAMLDGLLSTLTGVLDVREVFTRVSEITSKVLPHDAMALPIITDDGEHVIPFATVGVPTGLLPPISPIPASVKYLVTEPWDTIITDDIETDPKEFENIFARAGLHSMMRVAIRLDTRLVSILIVASRTIGAYTHADALIGRRIADHVAMAISHQRLADESKRTAALQERAANLQMLEGLLKTLTGVLDIRQVFDRVSEIAQQVLPHDAISIGEVINDGDYIRMYASQGLGRGAGPFDTPIRDRQLLTEAWDYRLMDDIAEHSLYAESAGTVGGMHSVLFVPIRLEERRIYGALSFYSKQKGHFKRDDALIAKRIADHIALALSHHRLAEESRRAAALEERAANLDALDGLLNTVAGVLDVRSVFDRISQIGRTVMPHDAMTIVVPSGKPGIARLYAATGDLSHLAVHMEIPVVDPKLLSRTWDFELLDDIAQIPALANAPAMKEGMRSILIMPIRSGELVAAVNFLSRTPGRFTRDDVPMARRITDHIALALSHEQLAEEMRKSAELRSRTANIGLLDALLASVTDTVDLNTVFDRVADIAHKVLPYDAMVVPVVLNDGARLKFHVLRTPPGVTFPETMDVPAHLRSTDWEYHIVDDMQGDPKERSHPFAASGLKSSLRIAIRVQGQLTCGVAFYSFEQGAYTEADVVIGRRIAARLAISLMREKGLEASKRADEASERATRLEARVQALTDELNARAGFHRVIGSSPTWRQALTQATQVAATETTVLLLGESGTGKEVVARFVHRASTRKNGPFVALNCAALPEQLLESELFGYERGAFTGAMNARAGKIEQAAGGVLFLDEVGEMSPIVQAKFLRVLQEREFQRLGGSKTLTADCRVIAATNRDPKAAMERGAFREDLYYRLSVFEISLPPLRDRRDDILLLVENFLSDLARNIGRPAGGLSDDAKDRLLAYHWPGNVRELRNAIERAVILAEGGLITSDHLPIAVGQSKPAPAAIPVVAHENDGAFSLPSGLKLENVERDLLHKAMAQAKNNKSQAAKLLGVPRGQFYSLLKRHGLTDAKR